MDRLRAAGALALALAAAPLTATGAPVAAFSLLAAVQPAAAAAGTATLASPDADPLPAGPVHRVRPGECLSVIAHQYGVGVAELARANGIVDPDFIQAGRVLHIPTAAGTAGATARRAGVSPAGTDSPATRPDPNPTVAEPAAVAAMAETGAGTAIGGPAAIPTAAGADLHVYYAANRPARRPAPTARRLRAPLRPAPLVAVAGVEEPVAALTFNGAPQAEYLPAILTVLERYRFRATFFVDPALAAQVPDLTDRLAAFGHELGSYGLPPADWPGARWIRPPGGVWDSETLAAAQRRGMAPVLWSSIGLRDHAGATPEHLAAQAAASLFPGAVLMLHADRPETAAALPQILRSIYAAGYAARTLSEVAELARSAAPEVK